MNRKSSILVSSLAAGALALGAAGAATASISAHAPARPAAAPPAPDPAAVRGEVSGLDAAAKAVAPLKAALAERPDAARVRQLVNQAKQAMDELARNTMAPESATPKSDDVVARAVPRVKRQLDAVARAAAAPNPDPGDLINSIQGVVQGVLQLLNGLLNGVHAPASTTATLPVAGR